MNVRALISISVVPSLAVLLAVPAAAQEPVAFRALPSRDIVLAPFSDREIGELVSTLDSLLAKHVTPARFRFDAEIYFQDFFDRLQRGSLIPSQEARIVGELTRLELKYPAAAPVIGRRRHALQTVSVGKTAPEISGRDLDGNEFRLSDYRGSVVVLAFSGEWCGACRSEYPYQRFLLDLYKDRPFVLLGVSSDSSPAAAKDAKTRRGLGYRAWWDGHGAKATEGPIATAWGVTAWPTIYVLDEHGVIRFINLRQEDLLTGVRQLMTELTQKKPH